MDGHRNSALPCSPEQLQVIPRREQRLRAGKIHRGHSSVLCKKPPCQLQVLFVFLLIVRSAHAGKDQIGRDRSILQSLQRSQKNLLLRQAFSGVQLRRETDFRIDHTFSFLLLKDQPHCPADPLLCLKQRQRQLETPQEIIQALAPLRHRNQLFQLFFCLRRQRNSLHLGKLHRSLRCDGSVQV